MRTGNRYALPLAGVLAVVANGCATRQASTSNPVAGAGAGTGGTSGTATPPERTP